MDPLLKSLKDPKILKQVRTKQSFLKNDLNVQTCLASIYLRIQGSSLVHKGKTPSGQNKSTISYVR